MSGGGRIISELANFSVDPFSFTDDAPLASGVAGGVLAAMAMSLKKLAGTKWSVLGPKRIVWICSVPSYQVEYACLVCYGTQHVKHTSTEDRGDRV